MAAGLSKKRTFNEERQVWLAQLRECQMDLDFARERFNEATQPELIEQCVFEVNALLARQAYFWRIIRESGEEGSMGA